MRVITCVSAVFGLLAVACGRGSNRSNVDTVMVFNVAPPPSAADSAKAPSEDSVLATIQAYRQNRITAAVAAPVIADYVAVGRILNVELEDELKQAVYREVRRRVSRQ